jgi:hypothetical protein
VGCFHLPNYPITKLPIYSILPLEHGRSIQVQIFVFSKSFVRHLTLGRCQTISVFFARINCESGHVHGYDNGYDQPGRAMGIRLSAGTGKLKLSPTKPVGSAQTNDRPSGNDIA